MDPRTQVEAARRAVLVVVEPELDALVVTGRDRLSWLNGLVTCDLTKRSAGEARYGLVVARNGRVLSDLVVVVEETRVLAFVPAALTAKLREHFDHYLVMEDVEFGAAGPGAQIWMVHGPRSGEVLEAALARGASGGVVDRTGLGGAIVFAAAGRAEVSEAIASATEGAGGVVGDRAGWEALRLERAVARFGADFDEHTYPQEASLEKIAVSFNKGCYLGQEVVCMLEMRGHVKRRLVPVVLEAGAPPAPGASVTDDRGAPAGTITSAATSPTLGKAVALAMLKRDAAVPGQRITVDGSPGQVVERPA